MSVASYEKTMSPYPKILGHKEASTIVSTWTEYLRLCKMDEKKALLEVCQYEVLGELQPSEDGERFVIPEEIDPSEVVGTDDGIIVGGQLLCSDDGPFCFEQDKIQDAIDWLKVRQWDMSDQLVSELRAVFAST